MVETSPQFSKSADANRQVIGEQLRKRCAPGAIILEVASGTGQHALHFTTVMPDVTWQASDRDLHAFGLSDAITANPRENLLPPIVLDVERWPNWKHDYDGVYSANCIHVMPHRLLAPYVAGAARTLKKGGMMILYGPFKYSNNFTTQSNEDFDAFLRGTYEDGGIRDFEEVDQLATKHGLEFHSDTDMPANNQFIIWRKTADG